MLGSSFGGLPALKAVLPALPVSFPRPVIVVQHRTTAVPDGLAAILRGWCAMPVDDIGLGYQLTAGRIGVASPAGFSAISEDRRISMDGVVTDGGSAPRPVDRVLAAVAKRFGRTAIAVIMTGRLSDGAKGVQAVKAAGGFVLAQDPAEAAADGMPTAALATGCVDHRLPLRLIGHTLVAVTMAPGALDLLRVPPPPWAVASTAG